MLVLRVITCTRPLSYRVKSLYIFLSQNRSVKRAIRTIKIALLGAAVGAGLYFAVEATPKASRYLLCHYKDDEIEEYVNENLEEIIAQQEEALGIHYLTRPTIFFQLPLEWRIDGNAMYAAGLYRPEVNTIYLNSGMLSHPAPDVGDLLAMTFTGLTNNVRDTLNHELGHFYCDYLSETMKMRDWPASYPGMSIGDAIGIRLVSEGIAEYFERKSTGNEEDHFSDADWPKTIDDFSTGQDVNVDVIYHGGYHLVKPIIDKQGTRGILYLMYFPPKKYDLLQLPKYQQVLLQQIEEEKFKMPHGL